VYTRALRLVPSAAVGAWSAVLTRPIRRDLIEQQYELMVKYATAIRLGTASAEAVLRRRVPRDEAVDLPDQISREVDHGLGAGREQPSPPSGGVRRVDDDRQPVPIGPRSPDEVLARGEITRACDVCDGKSELELAKIERDRPRLNLDAPRNI